MSDTLLRLAIFLAVFSVMAVLERLYALQRPPARRIRMQLINLTLGVLGAASVRLLAPLFGIFTAVVAGAAGVGLLPLAKLPFAIDVAIGIVVLDLAIYWQHRWMHAVPVLWRLHRSHHLDEHLDASAAVRFHPIEILGSALWRGLIVAVVGVPALAVLIFEIAINAAALFHHSNLRLPGRFDGLLRLAIVTPALHRVHHSILENEQRSNYGFSVTWWDRVFGSYLAASSQPGLIAQVGVQSTRAAPAALFQILRDPLNKFS